MEITPQTPIPQEKPQDVSLSIPDSFAQVKKEIAKEKMVLNTPNNQPNIIDAEFEVSDDSGQYILYARIASVDNQDLVLSHILNKLQKHSVLSQEFDLQNPLPVERVDFFYIFKFPCK
jgi:hypothetical protein